jgi:nucleotide-binding universal stress UspA family protein
VLTEVRTGNPAQAIEDAFCQNGASLVFMATHGRGGILRTITGSVAGAVIKDGRAPVVLIRPIAHVVV